MLLQKVSEKYNRLIRRDDDLKLALAKANDVKVSAIDRWLKADSDRLTTATNLTLIALHFGVNEKDLLETEVVNQKTAGA